MSYGLFAYVPTIFLDKACFALLQLRFAKVDFLRIKLFSHQGNRIIIAFAVWLIVDASITKRRKVASANYGVHMITEGRGWKRGLLLRGHHQKR